MTPLDAADGLSAALVLRIGRDRASRCWPRDDPRVARQVAFLGLRPRVHRDVPDGRARAAHGRRPCTACWLVHQASGFALTYTVDGLSAWFLVVLSVLAVPIAIFSIGYVGQPHLSRRSVFIGVAFNVLLGALELVFAADTVITFLFAWELITLATAALVATEHEERANRRAAYLYLVMSHVGTGCLIAGFLTLAAASGSAVVPDDPVGARGVRAAARRRCSRSSSSASASRRASSRSTCGCPRRTRRRRRNISALMSGVLIKTGIYGIVRVCAFGLGVPRLSWGVFVVAVGGLSAVLGVLYALMQHDLKRLLAYHSIENIGIILLGLGAAMMALAYGRSDVASMGIAASLFHVLNHAVFKGLLFLGAGGVVMATGTRQIEQFGGLLRRMPWTGLFFLIGAMAISGLPPLNGFASEWLTFQAFLFGFRGSAGPLVLLPVSRWPAPCWR